MPIRRSSPVLAAAALALMLGGCAMGPAGQASAGGTYGAGAGGGAAASSEDAARQVFALVNQHRATRGCPALQWMPAAARAAQMHSDDMAARRYFAHDTPEGKSPFQRLTEAGVNWRAAAENIAMHPGGPGATVDGWLHSAGHRANIENCGFTHTGVGVRGSYYTQVFATLAR
ncbi:MAG TPA: CAP domain-containing protein [Longimicrobiaceae bacterium]|jgi:uncharacterized protein YkwD|nr:CAP domain-containing protein [Longimicrobiaceae bacterium]